MKSGRLYSLVTKHWPRIAAGLVITLGLIEFVVGGLTADSGLELYLVAWAGATGGLWFLFERAEGVASHEVRVRAARWASRDRLTESLDSIPDRFADLFDLVFGVRHLSWRCLGASALASILSATLVVFLFWGLGVGFVGDLGMLFTDTRIPTDERVWIAVSLTGMLLLLAVIFTILPDYLSLLQTRYMIGWVKRSPRRFPLLLIADGAVTALIALIWMWFSIAVIGRQNATVGEIASIPLGSDPRSPREIGAIGPFAFPFFYSTFFTSVWLWFYAASVLLSRVLLKMNSGVGFLLRVTDVENQPFRSIGFVSVLIVSGLFLLGLPFVLL